MARSIDECPYRQVVSSDNENVQQIRGSTEQRTDESSCSRSVSCALVQQILDLPREDHCWVSLPACQTCVASFPPTPEDPNPVVASLAFSAAETRLNDLSRNSESLERLRQRQAFAEANLPRVLPAETDLGPVDESTQHRPCAGRDFLDRMLPSPGTRSGRRVTQWAVGITTAPRRQQVLAESVAELVRCGWCDPHLFVDGPMDLDPSLHNQGLTRRRQPLGAWGNFLLGLTELVEASPNADAYLMTQDDVRWPPLECLREYMEEILWPDSSGGLVSLYTCADDDAPSPGWRTLPGQWKYGALAFVFSRSTARRMTCDPWLRKHGWAQRHSGGQTHGVAGVDAAIGSWARRRGFAVWHPTPSLVQHAGHVSAIWPAARAVGVRRASKWIGDLASQQH